MHPLLSELKQFSFAYIENSAGLAATRIAFEKIVALAEESIKDRPFEDMDAEKLQNLLDRKEEKLVETMERAQECARLNASIMADNAGLRDDLAEAEQRAAIADALRSQNGYIDKANSHLIQALVSIDNARNV